MPPPPKQNWERPKTNKTKQNRNNRKQTLRTNKKRVDATARGSKPTLRIGRVPRLQKVQYSRLDVSRGPDYPLPTEPERVSATRKTHITAQTSLSRGLDYPTFMRIETVSILQKAKIRRAIHPFSTEKFPQQRRRS